MREKNVIEEMGSDERAILGIVEQLFEAISWDETAAPDLSRFTAPVLPEAAIIPSARPLAPTTIAAFAERMGGLHAAGAMKVFAERPLSSTVLVFGNIAVALGGYEARIDGGEPTRGANGFLFVREGESWRIAAMAWDSEREGVELPTQLKEPQCNAPGDRRG
jgi:hypothetical protein